MKIRVTNLNGLKSNDMWDHANNIITQTHVRIDFAGYDNQGNFVASWRAILTNDELFMLLQEKVIALISEGE